GARARRGARVREKHQREQSSHFAFVGLQRCQQPPEPDRLLAQLDADELIAAVGHVSLIEDEVDDCEHRGEAVRQLTFVGDAVRDARVTNLALSAHQPLRHRALADQERAGDLGGLQSTQQPERQGDLSGLAERRMTAGKDQAQAFVAHRTLWLAAHPTLLSEQPVSLLVALRSRGLAAQPVDRAVACGRDDPPRRARRHASFRPALARDRERLLHRVFGDVDIAEDADQDGDRTSVLLAKHSRDITVVKLASQSCGSSWNGRTSTGIRHSRAAFRAHASAASRSGALITQIPPMCSLPSRNGPSVTSTSPSESLSTVAVLDGCSPPAKTHAPAARSSSLTAPTSAMICSMSAGAGALSVTSG